MKLRVLLLGIAISAHACGGDTARGSLCADTQAALRPAEGLDLTRDAGVAKYRAMLIEVGTLAESLIESDRATVAPKLDAVIAELDASLAGQGSSWSSADLMETLWDWCGHDVGLAYFVQP
ncbi:MAG: hypothetical protein WD184_03780 [Acidimicrobiia bacterium]